MPKHENQGKSVHARLANNNRYYRWNKLYYPFKYFSTTPYDPFVPTNAKYGIDMQTFIQIYPNALSNKSTYLHGGQSNYKSLGGNHDENEQFTMVIYSYKRQKMLSYHLDLYLTMPYLKRIIVVWDSYETKPGVRFLFKYRKHLENKHLCIISNERDSLNNRFVPFSLIETDAVINIDDDTSVPIKAIEFGFRVWRQNRDKLIGFSQRKHAWNVTTNSFVYTVKHVCEYSIILTRVAFYHNFYSYLYTYVSDKRIRSLVDEYLNCEDLAFSYMIADLTRQPPLKVGRRTYDACITCQLFDNQMPSISLGGSHRQKRNKCLQYFNSIYGYNPLLYSQYRADSGQCRDETLSFDDDEAFLINHA
jgi:alpha-1,4-N-acetylglucosaminyltransferase EXTL3